MQVADYRVDPHSAPPGALYWITGRLLLFAGVGISQAIGLYAIGESDGLDLYWLYAGYCIVTSVRFLLLRASSIDRVRTLYEFILFVDILLIALVIFVVPVAWFSGAQISNQSSSLALTLAIATVPIDYFFCRWAIRKLQSMEFLAWWSHACHGIRLGSVGEKAKLQFGIPALLMWTTVLAGSFATFASVTREVRYRIVGGISTAYRDTEPFALELVELQRVTPFIGNGESHLIVAIRSVRDQAILRVTHNRSSAEVWIGDQKFVPTPSTRVTVFHADRRWALSRFCKKEDFLEFLGEEPSPDLSRAGLSDFLENRSQADRIRLSE